MPTHRRLYSLNASTTPTYLAVEASYEEFFLNVCRTRHPHLEFSKVLHELEELGVPQLSPSKVDLWLPTEWGAFIEFIDADQERRERERLEAEEVKPKDLEAEEVKPKDLEAEEVKPKDLEAEEVKPKDLEAEEVKPKDLEAEEVKPKDLEIQKMLVVNISHLPYSAQNLLAQGVESRLHPKLVNPSSLIVDPIGEYGWRVCVDSEATNTFFTASALRLEQQGFTNESRKALHDLIKFAQLHQCDWLAVDRDGPVIDDLPTYED